MGLHQVKKLLHSNGNNYQNEKTTFSIGKKSLPAVHQIKD
jgi:hypothetical protein